MFNAPLCIFLTVDSHTSSMFRSWPILFDRKDALKTSSLLVLCLWIVVVTVKDEYERISVLEIVMYIMNLECVLC